MCELPLLLARKPDGRKRLILPAIPAIYADAGSPEAMMNELLRLNDTVRRDPKIERWFFDHADPLRLVVRPWLERMRALGPDVREVLHDGCPVVCVGDAPFGYVNAFKAHASVGFFYGAMLNDPAHLLEGEGKRMRHMKLHPGKDLDIEALNGLIDAAYDDIRRRLRLA